jgi:2'-5' RNA ligase
MRTSVPMRRVFFALWPSEEQQTALADAARSALPAESGRLVPALNFHVTLVFVGSVAEGRMEELFKIAEHVSTASRSSREFGSGPLQLAFDTIEYWSRAKIICATATTPSAAAGALSEVLKTHLLAAGFAPDLKEASRPVGDLAVKTFRPHVTLVRKVAHPTRTLDIHPVFWSFDDFALVDSRTESKGSVYRVLQTFPLGMRKGSD